MMPEFYPLAVSPDGQHWVWERQTLFLSVSFSVSIQSSFWIWLMDQITIPFGYSSSTVVLGMMM